MKAKIIGIGIAAIVVVAALALFFYEAEASPYWETEAEFGSWGEEIIITYTDGTIDSLKLIEASAPPGELTYGGKGINTVHYQIRAQATGEGYDEAVIKITNYVINVQILKGTTEKWSNVVSKGTSTNYIAIDGQWHDLALDGGANFWDIFKQYDWADGTYILRFTPGATGDPKYWGHPGQTESDGTFVSLPNGKDISVKWSADKTLTVVLGADIET